MSSSILRLSANRVQYQFLQYEALMLDFEVKSITEGYAAVSAAKEAEAQGAIIPQQHRQV